MVDEYSCPCDVFREMQCNHPVTVSGGQEDGAKLYFDNVQTNNTHKSTSGTDYLNNYEYNGGIILTIVNPIIVLMDKKYRGADSSTDGSMAIILMWFIRPLPLIV